MNRRRRRAVITLAMGAVALGTAPVAMAQAPRRVAVLFFNSPEIDASVAAMRTEIVDSMAELGHVEGRNIAYQWLFSNRDEGRLRALAADLVRSRPDAALTHLGATTEAVAKLTTTIPIVAHVTDHVLEGYSRDGVMPSKNVTGASDFWGERVTKLLEALKWIIPGFSRFAIVTATRDPLGLKFVGLAERISRTLGIEPHTFIVSSSAELEAAFASMPARGIRAATTIDAWHMMSATRQAELAIQAGVALVTRAIEPGSTGQLLHINPDFENPNPALSHSPIRRQTAQLDKILRGIPVHKIPFELPRKLLFTVNLKTAAALGLRVPQEALLRADRVIE